MYGGNESLSDTEDEIPRSAPRPIKNDSEKNDLSPIVPEVSLVFGPTTVMNKFENSSNHNVRIERALIKNNPSCPSSNINPMPPKLEVPELSLVSNKNDSNHHLMNSDVKACHSNSQSSLPIKSFSNFKLEYGSLISSIENKTRKNMELLQVQKQDSIDKENAFFEESNDHQNDSNTDTELMNDTREENNNSEVVQCHCGGKMNENISKRLDSLTTLMESFFSEFKEVKDDIRELRNIILNNSEIKINAYLSNNKSFTISDENIEHQQNVAQRCKNLKDSFNGDNCENIENQNIPNGQQNWQEIKYHQPHISSPNNTTKRSSPSRNSLLKKNQNHLETLPESAPLLVYNQSVNRSMAMKKLAEKYLTEDKYKVYIEGNIKSDEHIKLNNCVDMNKKCTDMSIDSYDYLKKYNLMPENPEIKCMNDHINTKNNEVEGQLKQNNFFFQDIKKGPKYM